VVLALLAWASAAVAQQHSVARFAIVIGSNQPPTSAQVPVLRYADDDAIAFHQLLTEAGADSTLLVAPDPETRELWPSLSHRAPTLADLERSTAELAIKVRAARAAGRHPELLLFYSGHGDVDDDGSGFVVMNDARLTRSRLHGVLTQVAAEHNHVIVDACKSYFLAFERGPGGWRTPYVGPPLVRRVPSELANTGFVLSTSNSGVSHEWEHYRAGVVSYELRSALRGAADADHDGVLTYTEIGAFVAKANERLPPNVRPDVLLKPPDGQASLLTWPGSPSVELDASGWGHVYVETAGAQRLLDTHPQAGQVIRLWIPAERPAFVRRHDESAEYLVDQTELARVDPGTATKPTRTSKGAIGLAFERELFSVPFGLGDVQGYQIVSALPSDTALDVAAPSGVRPLLLWSGAAASVLLATTGVALNVAAHSEFERTAQLVGTCADCDSAAIRERQATGRSLETWSWIAIGAGVGLGAATLATYWLSASRDSRSPRVSIALGAVQLDGRF
jgi:hypothetical protein